jgi:Cu/Zn superoxide dismutase
MRRITKAALGGVAACGLILGTTHLAVGAEVATYRYVDDLKDLHSDAEGPLDDANAKVTIVQTTDGTNFSIRVTGIDPDAAGVHFHSHLHTGPCIKDNGSAAGGHYNTGLIPGNVSPLTEVWFELVPDDEGMASDETLVDFVPVDSLTPGVMSIVIHNPDFPSIREACFPLQVPQWEPGAVIP